MTTITWRELRENLADIINRVRYTGEAVQITRHGKVVAELCPAVISVPNCLRDQCESERHNITSPS